MKKPHLQDLFIIGGNLKAVIDYKTKKGKLKTIEVIVPKPLYASDGFTVKVREANFPAGEIKPTYGGIPVKPTKTEHVIELAYKSMLDGPDAFYAKQITEKGNSFSVRDLDQSDIDLFATWGIKATPCLGDPTLFLLEKASANDFSEIVERVKKAVMAEIEKSDGGAQYQPGIARSQSTFPQNLSFPKPEDPQPEEQMLEPKFFRMGLRRLVANLRKGIYDRNVKTRDFKGFRVFSEDGYDFLDFQDEFNKSGLMFENPSDIEGYEEYSVVLIPTEQEKKAEKLVESYFDKTAEIYTESIISEQLENFLEVTKELSEKPQVVVGGIYKHSNPMRNDVIVTDFFFSTEQLSTNMQTLVCLARLTAQ